MNLVHLVVREIAFRKLGFVTSLLAVVAAVACLTASLELLEDHDQVTKRVLSAKEAENFEIRETHRAELVALAKKNEDETRKNMKNLGFNILILPKDLNLADLYADDFASKYMPESYVMKLADAKDIVSINHLLPSLTQKLAWPEQHDRTIILIGVRGEVPFKERAMKKPLINPVPKGFAVLGYELWATLGLSKGDKITLLGEKLEVQDCYAARGSKDDITIWIDLATAQRLLDKPAQINAILALECRCAADRLEIIRQDIARVLPDTQVIEKGTKATVRAEQRARAKKHVEDVQKARERENGAALAAEESTRTELRTERESFAAALIPLAVIASAVLIAILAFLNVRERRSEIGILRAIGLGAGKVLQVVVARALLVGLAGAAIGFPIGHFIATIRGDSEAAVGLGGALFDPTLLILALVISPLVAMIASWVPALIASQQDPADVLREA
jgi:ABC-type lipoprotein release transport system permease subunit